MIIAVVFWIVVLVGTVAAIARLGRVADRSRRIDADVAFMRAIPKGVER